jgi:hypothetical protein
MPQKSRAESILHTEPLIPFRLLRFIVVVTDRRALTLFFRCCHKPSSSLNIRVTPFKSATAVGIELSMKAEAIKDKGGGDLAQ